MKRRENDPLDRPTVAIVGRPNVGKSTLFNRLIGHRRAITDATPGVTRDPVAVNAEIGAIPVRLIDTGGYTSDQDEMARAITSKALLAIDSADVILLVVDATELTAADELFLEQLRPYNDRLVLVVNKIDTPERGDLVWDFYRLGLERVVGVSAAHGRGTDELIASVTALLPQTARPEESPVAEEPPAPEGSAATEGPDRASGRPTTISIAVLGRPNTGKSTLVNRLTGHDGSIVSQTPGTTRDVIEGAFVHSEQSYRILDTAGLRRKARVSENIEYYSVTRAIDTIEDAEVVVLLVDAEKGLSDQDKKIASLIVDRGRGLVIGLNKWDLMPRIGNQFEAVRDRIRFVFPVISFAPIVPVSARSGSGVPKLLEEVGKVHRQLYHRVDTGTLNRHLEEWLERTPPPVRGRGRLKVRYMTQVQRFPITFIAFVNRRKGFPDSYVGYLKNQIRADFGLSSIPFRLELRER